MKIYKYIKIYVEKVEKYLFMLKYNRVYKNRDYKLCTMCKNCVQKNVFKFLKSCFRKMFKFVFRNLSLALLPQSNCYIY